MSDEDKTGDATPEGKKVGTVDFAEMSIGALQKWVADAEAAINDKIEAEKAKMLSNLEREAAKFGLLPRVEWSVLAAPEPEVETPSKGRSKARGKVPAKFRGPEGEEWSGRGRPPKWLVALEAAGRNREEFLV